MTQNSSTEARIRIGRNGAKVHRANLDGNTYCGSQSAGGRSRQGVTFLPADTAVTCTKCDPAAATAPAVETAPERVRCTNVVYGEVCGSLYRPSAGCAMCA